MAIQSGEGGSEMQRDIREILHGRRALFMAAGCAAALVLAVVSIVACRRGGPVIGPGERPPTQDGTISGTVRGPEGTTSIAGREVEVVNVDTGERQRTVTNDAGGFTFKVKPGKYRVDVAVLTGESVIKRPGVMNVNRSDVDAHADFVLGSAKASRKKPAAPVGTLVGQPIA
jgi:Carboxypeptidase regulatory-like domain